jgi:hypothetical protein
MSGYFNDDQESWMENLASIPREKKCASGWHVLADEKCDCKPLAASTGDTPSEPLPKTLCADGDCQHPHWRHLSGKCSLCSCSGFITPVSSSTPPEIVRKNSGISDSETPQSDTRQTLPAQGVTEFDVREARELCEAASLGPWRVEKVDNGFLGFELIRDLKDVAWNPQITIGDDGGGSFARQEDADFCAAARTLLPAACDRITTLESQLREVSAERDTARKVRDEAIDDAQHAHAGCTAMEKRAEAAESSLSLARQKLEEAKVTEGLLRAKIDDLLREVES